MLMKMYEMKNDNNTVGKTLLNEVIYDIKFKGNTSIINPVVIIRSDNLILSNYAYIEEFQRYYFVNNIEIYPNGMYHITLHCDVLESFKDDILNSSGFINQQSISNDYYNSDYQSEIKKEVDIYKSNVTLDMSIKETILVTIGGV